MMRRTALLSSRIFALFHTISTNSLNLHLHHLHRQVPAGLNFAELLMTESAQLVWFHKCGRKWLTLLEVQIVLKLAKEGDTSNQVRPFITFVLGGPGSGKGTQCAKIAETFGFVHLSAGELLRKQISSGCENGAMILDIINEGKIVPSEITIKLIWKAIELSKSRKILIDGFPRTDENRFAFEKIIGVEPDLVVFFDCPEGEMVKRLLSRNQGRVDDNLETIKKRLKVFDNLNLPVINYYSSKGIVHKIKAVGTTEEVFEKVYPIFASLSVD